MIFLPLALISKALIRMRKPQDMNLKQKKELYYFLAGFVSENKREKFENIIPGRTRHISIVLEDIFQPHNASAVLRSCECFGIQDVHIIENRNKYEVNPDVALGSSKWLSLYSYNQQAENTEQCLQSLKDSGYRIIATSPHNDDETPETLPLERKIALVFGTEKEGLSQVVLRMADGFVKIPMYGFTESLNISVSAALLIRSLSERLRKSDIGWQLSEEERLDLLISWARVVVKNPDMLEKKWRNDELTE